MQQQQNQSTQESQQSQQSEGFISNVSKSLGDVAEAPTTTAEVETTEVETQEEKPLDLEAALDDFDGVESESTETEETEEFSYESEQFQALEKFVKEKFGVESLKEAVEGIIALQNKVAEFEQAQSAQTVEKTANQLKAEWNVNDAEYARRINLISDYHTKLRGSQPELAKQLDNAEGMQIIWNRIQKKSPGVSSKGTRTTTTSGPTFKKSDITKWMLYEPATYQANAAAIAEARKAGRITND